MSRAPMTDTGGSTSPTNQQLINAARMILDNSGISFSTNRILRLVLRFKGRCPYADGFLFFEYLCGEVAMTAEQRQAALNHPEIVNALMYPDLTGEDAVWNVMHPKRTPRNRVSQMTQVKP